MSQAVQLLVVDWFSAVWWALLRACRQLSRGEDLVAAWDSFHYSESADFPPSNFLFVHLNHLTDEIDGRLHVAQLFGLSVKQAQYTIGQGGDLVGDAGQ